MPLHIRGECCKCKSNFFFDIWSISRNHKFSGQYIHICNHFDVEIEHESSIGLFGWGWSNHIKLYAIHKQNNEKQIIIDEEFNKKILNIKIIKYFQIKLFLVREFQIIDIIIQHVEWIFKIELIMKKK